MPAQPPSSLVDAALRGMLLALLLLLAVVLGRERPRLPAARAGVAMVLGLAVQVVGSAPILEATLPRLWQAPLVAVAVANAVLFWVFVQSLFDDEFAFRPVHVAAWLGTALLGGLNCALVSGSASPLGAWSLGLQRAVPLLFALLAARAAAAHWRTDLVEGRRRLRGFIAVTGIAYTLAMLGARLGAPHGRLSDATALLDVLALLAIMGVIALSLLRLGGSEIFPSAPAAAVARADPPTDDLRVRGPDAAERALAEGLSRLMTEARAYRDEGLSVASLAARLAVPEYRLRRLINQRLGHRNFNAFVNGFRLDEARAALADPARRALPVLTIALDAGFQSIGPFNRAFKAATGMTPSEYRRQS